MSIFGDAVNFIKSAPKAVANVAKGVSTVVQDVGNAVGGVAKVVTNNPVWDIAATGVSFIPGVGTAVSAGMAAASALGRGASIADIGLAAAKGALPGGPAAAAAFDIATGIVIKGKSPGAAVLDSVRKNVPGGELGKAAFDASVMIASGKALDTVALSVARNRLPAGPVRTAFDTSINVYRAKNAQKGKALMVGITGGIPTAAFGQLGKLGGLEAQRFAKGGVAVMRLANQPANAGKPALQKLAKSIAAQVTTATARAKAGDPVAQRSIQILRDTAKNQTLANTQVFKACSGGKCFAPALRGDPIVAAKAADRLVAAASGVKGTTKAQCEAAKKAIALTQRQAKAGSPEAAFGLRLITRMGVKRKARRYAVDARGRIRKVA